MAEGKIALVTGAGSGIGRSASLALQGEGYSVSLLGRREDALEETAGMAAPEGGEMLVIPTDVTDPNAVASAFKKTKDAFGKLNLLFNNAGSGTPPVPMEELTPEQWQAVVNVNLNGSFYCAQEAIKIMKAQKPKGGRIINNGSISAHVPRPFSAPYTSTKHAITGLTKCISLDGRKDDICCCQLDIGNAMTPLAKRMADGVPQADGSIKAEPLMDVEHVGQAIVYMDSLPPEANIQFMTIMATKMPFIGRG